MSHSSKIELSADSHLPISTRSLELLKWLALACMLQEHFFRFVVGELPELSHAIGRLTFPLFAYCLSVGFVHASAETKWHIHDRLWVWAFVAQLCTLAVDDRAFGNVLFIFAASTTLMLMWNRILIGFAFVLLIPLSLLCEFGPLGIVAVIVMCLAHMYDELDLPLLALAVTIIAFINSDWVPLLSVPIILCAQLLDFGPPRVRHLFYWAYAFQFPVFGAIAWLS